MNIEFLGEAKNVVKKEISFAAFWFINKLLSKHIIEQLNIKITFDINDILENYKKMSLNGLTQCLTEKVYPKDFKIYLKPSQTRRQLLSSLAHELVHVKQFAKNELHHSCRYWNKQKVDYNDTNYFDLPFEIEAFGREAGLIIRYLNYVKVNKLSF